MRTYFLIVLFLFVLALPVSAQERRRITGYGPFDFTETATPGEVERAGGSQLSIIEKGKMYSYRSVERFEGLIDFVQYHRDGKIPPARQTGSVPKINSTELRLENGKLWLILLYFNPHDYDEYLRIIKLEYGKPSVPTQKDRSGLRKDIWIDGKSCIVLQQVMMDNTLTGGQMEIMKERCER